MYICQCIFPMYFNYVYTSIHRPHRRPCRPHRSPPRPSPLTATALTVYLQRHIGLLGRVDRRSHSLPNTHYPPPVCRCLPAPPHTRTSMLTSHRLGSPPTFVLLHTAYSLIPRVRYIDAASPSRTFNWPASRPAISGPSPSLSSSPAAAAEAIIAATSCASLVTRQ